MRMEIFIDFHPKISHKNVSSPYYTFAVLYLFRSDCMCQSTRVTEAYVVEKKK